MWYYTNYSLQIQSNNSQEIFDDIKEDYDDTIWYAFDELWKYWDSIKWYNIDYLKEFSIKYPDVMFILKWSWEEAEDIWFKKIKNWNYE